MTSGAHRGTTYELFLKRESNKQSEVIQSNAQVSLTPPFIPSFVHLRISAECLVLSCDESPLCFMHPTFINKNDWIIKLIGYYFTLLNY